MKFARLNGINLCFRVAGPAAGPAVVLINSLGTDARIWDGVIELVADRYRVVSYDKRGHGLSEAPRGDYSLSDHVADLAALVEHLRLDRFTICGVSVGGLIAQSYALEDARRLSALILCDTAARIGDSAMWNGRMDAVRTAGLGSIADGVMGRWFSPAYRRRHPEDLAGWRAMLERTPVEGYLGTCATLRDADLRDAIGGIVTPTLLIAGEQDQSTPVELVRETAARIKGARLEVLSGAGHIPSIEQPARLATLMAEFLEEVGHGR